jgi:hypothetical protein
MAETLNVIVGVSDHLDHAGKLIPVSSGVPEFPGHHT